MDTLNGRPKLLKQANLSLIRKVITAQGTATRAEIARKTNISSTTVRSLLAEMLENGEIESLGFDASSGGRKAQRYGFRPGRYHGAAVCLYDGEAYGLLVDVCGQILQTTPLEMEDGMAEAAIFAFLDGLTREKEIKAIGVGVPGIVEGGCVLRKDKNTEEFHKTDLGSTLARRYGLPVVLENDLNATAIGLGRCYEHLFPREGAENTNMAYLHFEEGCVSAGFIAGGRIVRGCNNFAGELGLVPQEDERLLDEVMKPSLSDAQYTRLVVRVLGWICGILNPRYVVLGGASFRKNCLGALTEGLTALLPKNMLAELLYSADHQHDYHSGMAWLTAAKMFDEVHLVKE
ncbi:ROK family transcriptional regulator [Allofournierella sp.]|uniref:ROK family transcriptional regulator n=1 Tax=Allofournierella sp. TaxID=1940256 RepID=UPI003AB1E851